MPPLLGALQEHLDDWRITLSCAAAVIALSTIFYLIGLCLIPASLAPVMSVEILDETSEGLMESLRSANGSEYDFKRYWEEVEERIKASEGDTRC